MLTQITNTGCTQIPSILQLAPLAKLPIAKNMGDNLIVCQNVSEIRIEKFLSVTFLYIMTCITSCVGFNGNGDVELSKSVHNL